jgi:hypothetical protein
MKYRIKNITIVKREKCEIFTSDIEKERKRILRENPGFRVEFSYDIIEEEKAPQ